MRTKCCTDDSQSSSIFVIDLEKNTSFNPSRLTLLDRSMMNKLNQMLKSGYEIYFHNFLCRFETAGQHDLNYFYGAVKCGWATRTIIF